MFRGAAQLNLDAKGRIAIPAKYRSDLVSSCSGNLVVTVHPTSECLLVYPKPTWEPIEQELGKFPNFDPVTRGLQLLLIGNASDQEMDSSGRILIAPHLRRIAGLSRDVVLVGQVSKFELWDAKKWDLEMENIMTASKKEVPEELQKLSL